MSEMNAMLTSEQMCLMFMAAMFGLIMLGLWLEARKALNKVSEHEHAAILRQCEVEYRRMLKRREARERLTELRSQLTVMPVTNMVPATEAQPQLGPEHISRIIDRLCGLAPELDAEWNTIPELHFVQGGARTPQSPVTRESATSDQRQRRHA